MDARLAAIDDEYIDVGAHPGLTSIGSMRESQQWNDRIGLRRPATWNANPPRPPRTKQRNTQSKRTSNHAREQVRRRSEPCSDQACIWSAQRPIGGRPTQRRLHQTNKHKPSDTRRKQSNEQSVAGLSREPAMTRQPLRRVAAASLDVLNAACVSARTSRLSPRCAVAIREVGVELQLGTGSG